MDFIWAPVPKCGSSKLSAIILLSQIVSDAKCLSAAQRSTVSWPGDFHYPQQYPCYAIQGALRGGLQRPLFVFYTVHLPTAGNSWSSICFFHLFQFPLQTLYRFLFSLTTGNGQRCTERGFCRRKWRCDNCFWTCHAGRTSMSTPLRPILPLFPAFACPLTPASSFLPSTMDPWCTRLYTIRRGSPRFRAMWEGFRLA